MESLMSAVGGKGRFQIKVQLLLGSVYSCVLVFNHIIMAFHGTPVPHTCMAGTDFHTAEMNQSESVKYYKSKIVVNTTHSSCSSTLFLSDGQNETVECSKGQWKYDPLYQERNIVSQFDLVCSGKYLANMATTIYFAGVMVGGLIFGDLADRLGRLPVILFTLYTSTVLGVITAFSVNHIMFMVVRFVNGMLIQGLQTASYTLIMELFVPKYRPFAGAVTECFFGMAVMLLGGLAYGIRDWKYLQIVTSLTGVLGLAFPWIIPESLRWLIIKGKMDKAEIVLQKICKTNKLPFPTDKWEHLILEFKIKECVIHTQKNYSLVDIFKAPHIRKRSLILFFLWLAISSSFYGLTFKMTLLKGNRYLTFFLGGALETIAYAISLPVMNKFGRKKPLQIGFITAFVLCLSSGLIGDFTTGLSALTISLSVVGRCVTGYLFALIFVYSSEIYPTVIRNIGMGACCFWARVGGVIAPQINQWTKTLYGVDAIIIFGVLALVAGLLLFFLPETHNQKLPDSLEEVEVKSKERKVADSARHVEEDGDVTSGVPFISVAKHSDQV